MGGRKDWRKEGRKGRGKGRGGTCSKVLGGIDAPGWGGYQSHYFSYSVPSPCPVISLPLFHPFHPPLLAVFSLKSS